MWFGHLNQVAHLIILGRLIQLDHLSHNSIWFRHFVQINPLVCLGNLMLLFDLVKLFVPTKSFVLHQAGSVGHVVPLW